MNSPAPYFHYTNGQLYVEEIALADLAQRFGTPCYIYSHAALVNNYQIFKQAFSDIKHHIFYAVKANSNLSLLRILAQLGAGFDIVSGGELARVIAAGGDPKRVVFSGVGKTKSELEMALLLDIACFNIESRTELELLNQIAMTQQKKAPIAIRINPDIDIQSHPYIATGLKENKFGIAYQDALPLYRLAASLPGILVTGIDCHIGSQMLDLSPFKEALIRLMALVTQLTAEGILLKHIDLGGGLGVAYQNEIPPSLTEYASIIRTQLQEQRLSVYLEPGRALVANSGVLLTQILAIKDTEHRHFAIVDAAMNDLLRPALYHAVQPIVPIQQKSGVAKCYDIVGPICESGDFLGKNRELTIEPSDLLAITMAGAYGFVMSSNYNTRPRIAEILVNGHDVDLIRKRETIADLLAPEQLVNNDNCVDFAKMHGLGNDFMVIETITQHLPTSFLAPAHIQALANRHTGIGFDQLLLIESPQPSALSQPSSPEIDFYYRIFNADGSEVGQCGNGARCLAEFVAQQQLSNKNSFTVATETTCLQLTRIKPGEIAVDFNPPLFLPNEIPINSAQAQTTYQLADDKGASWTFAVVNVGNPHAVIFVDDVLSAPIDTLGRWFNQQPLFPMGVNVGFAQVLTQHHIKLRVFERGVGETLACGSGAVAASVIAITEERVQSPVTVSLPGGDLVIAWQPGEKVRLLGPAVMVFKGTLKI